MHRRTRLPIAVASRAGSERRSTEARAAHRSVCPPPALCPDSGAALLGAGIHPRSR